MAKKTPKTTDEQAPPRGEIRELPLVALRETVIFPEMIVPLQVGRDKSVAALNAAVAGTSFIALVTLGIKSAIEHLTGHNSTGKH